ncbi:MAG: flavodoxin family protein, partial [Candidatus Aegiribacteria sp.]|nr:flavodoxin family protein [Candidatus Aegiribacteria sp.]
MIVTALNGSPRSNGNTACLLNTVIGVLEDAGIETRMLQLGGKYLHGCTACGKCFENKDRKCIIDDGMNELMDSIFNSDGMLIGSPTYFSNISTE